MGGAAPEKGEVAVQKEGGGDMGARKASKTCKPTVGYESVEG